MESGSGLTEQPFGRTPTTRRPHYGLGVAYFNLGLLEESSDELAEAARLMPENPNIQFQLAVVLYDLSRQGRSEAEGKAIDRLKRTILLQPGHSDAHLLMANIQRSKRQWSEMLVSWEKAASGAGDHVLNLLLGYTSERRQVLEALERQRADEIERVTAVMTTPKKAKGPSSVGPTLGIFVLLFVAAIVLGSVQATLGSFVLLAAFASLIVTPLVMRSRRRRAVGRFLLLPPVAIVTPQLPTVSSLLSEARDLNRKIESTEQMLQNHQTVSPYRR